MLHLLQTSLCNYYVVFTGNVLQLNPDPNEIMPNIKGKMLCMYGGTPWGMYYDACRISGWVGEPFEHFLKQVSVNKGTS